MKKTANLLLDHAPCGYAALDGDGLILHVNQTLAKTLGYFARELEGESLNKILSFSAKAFFQLYAAPLIRMEGQIEEMYISLVTQNGVEIPVLLNASKGKFDGDEVIQCVFIPMRRRSEFEHAILEVKKETEERNRMKRGIIAELDLLRLQLEEKQKELLEVNARLQILAATDALTGLNNRRTFQESLSRLAEVAEQNSSPLSLILLDLDHFKMINDTYGHLMGDRILHSLGEVLQDSCPDCYMPARYGGEEFAIILPDTDITMAADFAEKMRFFVESRNWAIPGITVSAGVAELSPGESVEALQLKADHALYSSKHAGRNRVTAAGV